MSDRRACRRPACVQAFAKFACPSRLLTAVQARVRRGHRQGRFSGPRRACGERSQSCSVVQSKLASHNRLEIKHAHYSVVYRGSTVLDHRTSPARRFLTPRPPRHSEWQHALHHRRYKTLQRQALVHRRHRLPMDVRGHNRPGVKWRIFKGLDDCADRPGI